MISTDLLPGLASLLAPERCLVCPAPRWRARGQSWLDWLCPSCMRQLEPIQDGCPRCALPERRGRCPECRRATGDVATTTALFRYRRLGRQVLRQVKYRGRAELAPRLGEALARRWREAWPRRARDPRLVVVPVPLHPLRRWRRGFNQAEEIARGVAEVLERPLLAAALVRRRSTQPLFRVARGSREQVLRGSFQVSRPALLTGRPVLLVDDIRTSGATLKAATAALRRAGVTRVDAAVVAR